MRAVQVNFADDSPDVPAPEEAEFQGDIYSTRRIDPVSLPTRWLLERSADGESWFPLADKRDSGKDLSHDLAVREDGVSVRCLKLTVFSLPYGQAACVSGLRVFGLGHGDAPAPAANVQARWDGDLDLCLTWDGDAVGYEVLWGYAPDRLYHSYEVFGKKVRLGGLVKGQPVYVRVDSFNESGITEGAVNLTR